MIAYDSLFADDCLKKYTKMAGKSKSCTAIFLDEL